MAKKHQIKISNASTRRAAGRKWRRQAKASLKEVAGQLRAPVVKPKAPKTAKVKQPKVYRPKRLLEKDWTPNSWLV